MEHAQRKSASPLSAVKSAFLSHPHSVGESYFEHLRMALGFAGALFITALAAVVHALIPCLCETTARRRIYALNTRLQARDPDAAIERGE